MKDLDSPTDYKDSVSVNVCVCSYLDREQELNPIQLANNHSLANLLVK